MLRAMIRAATVSALFVCLALSSARPACAVDCSAMAAAQARYTVCHVNLRDDRLRVYYADANGVRYESLETLRASLTRQGETLEFAMNAGMFHPGFEPVGLLVIDSRMLAPLNRAPGLGNFFLQPNGVLVLDALGARVVATSDYDDLKLKPEFATQSGPMLVHAGQIPQISAFRASSRSRNIRNGVCAPTTESVVFVISETAVTLHEFARFFQGALGCKEALYLDGSISSLYSRALARSDSRAQLGPMIGVAR